MDRIGEKYSSFTLDSFNVHRILLLSLVSSIKFYDDAFYTNSYYAKIGGLAVQEFNQLEQEYLVNYIEFSLLVDAKIFASYYEALVSYYNSKFSTKAGAC